MITYGARSQKSLLHREQALGMFEKVVDLFFCVFIRREDATAEFDTLEPQNDERKDGRPGGEGLHGQKTC